jgi:hypothetical protein
MKDYGSIPKVLKDYINLDCIAFRKYDGSQIRCEWHKKKGWHKWATRGHLFDKTDVTFGCAIDAFSSQADLVAKAIVDNYPKVESAVAFMEFVGPHSFAGIHDPAVLKVEHNDPKELVLFDVNIHKRGLVSPENFVKHFGHTRSAEVLYQGKLTDDFIKDVREGKFPVDEGVVCKGGEGHKIWLCKIKTWEYLKQIQKFFGSSYGQYWE